MKIWLIENHTKHEGFGKAIICFSKSEVLEKFKNQIKIFPNGDKFIVTEINAKEKTAIKLLETYVYESSHIRTMIELDNLIN